MSAKPICDLTYGLVCEAMRNARENRSSLMHMTDDQLVDDLMDCDADIADCEIMAVHDAVAVWRNNHEQF